MDTRIEDTMVRQIEKNLSEQMNENLFFSGRAIEDRTATVNNQYTSDKKGDIVLNEENDYPLVAHDYIGNSQGLTRAEYIRQAREACLRQLSAVQIYTKPYETNYMETEAIEEDQQQKKAKVMELFHEVPVENNEKVKESNNKELISYRSLLIRCVCAIVLFLSVFLLDKFKVSIGDFSHNMIKEYVTGNDALKQLENILVTWLK